MSDRRRKDIGPPPGFSDRRSGVDRRVGPKDRRQSRGFPLNIATTVSVFMALLALLGYIYTTGKNDNSIDNKLDRNCRILAVIQADSRFLIIEHTDNKEQADAFREIFRKAASDSC